MLYMVTNSQKEALKGPHWDIDEINTADILFLNLARIEVSAFQL